MNRQRKYLTREEVQHLLAVTGNRIRDCCMIKMCFIHGLRVSELTGLRLENYDPLSQKIHIRRLKGGGSTTHPILPEVALLLHRWLCERNQSPGRHTPWLFTSRSGGRLSRQRVYQLIRDYGAFAKLPLLIHPHMLRHACGYGLAENGNDTRLIQDYLGHRNIRHTVLYTAGNAERFAHAWSEQKHRQAVSPTVTKAHTTLTE
ncbi:tyrosine-type recombinase/integrase [Serratia marcescens]|nr:tyrosine-type recombinase/integrase [Serratia marcescens]MBH2766670.1 tyrosine-type recombinase/integrase [Serratia marcescens]MBH2766730.1 tyrosine-type recombinase/integrase [Serratia marcescens]